MNHFLRKKLDGSILILLLSVVLFSWTHFSEESEPSEEFQLSSQWTVSEGESLWTIASMASKEMELTIEEAILWIQKENELNNVAIYPGQTLKVPTEMKGVATE
ncbi:cell division suppressor protein YneA [Salipaludibacillus keqinensis]|nr:LysM peptidoglycan-binding domain-containing protein [Salipaludibacillus keqinensis]